MLKKFEPFLNNDKIDYDHKLQKVTDEYEKLIEIIQEKSFKIKIPNYLSPLLQDYNDFYKFNDEEYLKKMEQLKLS